MPYIEGAKEYQFDDTPVNGTDSVWTLTIAESPTSGTFKLMFDGYTTAPITWSATNGTLLANIDAALEALSSIGAGATLVEDVNLASGVGDLTITFTGSRAKSVVLELSVVNNSLIDSTDPTIVVEETTTGVLGVNEIQRLTIGNTPTGGTFKLAYDGQTTADITWSATNSTLIANIDGALEALSNIEPGEVTTAAGTLVGGIGTIFITFSGALAEINVPMITVADNSLTDASTPTIAIVETTPGDTGTNEVQTLTIGNQPTGGTFKLEFDGQTTAAITWSATNITLLANIDAALEALSNIGAGEVACAATTLTAGIGALTITFSGTLAETNVATITVADNSLTHATTPTLVFAQTTQGIIAVNEIQTITFGGTPTTGTFKLGYGGQTTAAITWNATNNTLRDRIDAALEALSNIAPGEVTCAVGTMTDGIGTITVTFSGALAETDLELMTVEDNSLDDATDPTLAITETTPGVDATMRGASIGAVIRNVSDGKLYINAGTAQEPTWTVVGLQS
jgi:hypothetical protein